MPKILRGPRCWFCGCTDKRACPGGCFWLSNVTKPTCSSCPTPRQVVVLKALRTGVSFRQLAKVLGMTSPHSVEDHIKRLVHRGFVKRSKHGERKLTDLGLQVIGLRCCPGCKGRGVVAISPRARLDMNVIHYLLGNGPICGASMACTSTDMKAAITCDGCRKRIGMEALG